MFYTADGAAAKARKDYASALRRANWRKLRAWLGNKCNELLPAEQVLKYLELGTHKVLGIQEVPTERIVGSLGRQYDFDLAFLPRRKEREDRWLNIAQARHEGVDLPPPTLYKIGDAYFVEDGNHRVSVARAGGETHLSALVIEIDSAPLKADHSCTRLGLERTPDAHR